MTGAAEIKRAVPIEAIYRYYGGIQDARGRWRCLKPENHNNADIHYSVTIDAGWVTCWSQRCFGETGADQFGLVGSMENLPGFFDQKQRVCEIGGIANGRGPSPRRIIRRFQWVDEAGRTAWHLRWEPGDPKFTWAQDSQGKRPGRGLCTPALYNLSAVKVAETVILVEGERDAGAVNEWLLKLNIFGEAVATTTPNGAGDVKPEYLDLLNGKLIVLSGDADQAGEKYVNTCGALLHGKARSLKVLAVPSGFNDWSEWSEAGVTAEAFSALFHAAPMWTDPRKEISLPRPMMTWNEFLRQPRERGEWLIDSLARPGWLLAVIGHGKRGKTTIMLHALAAVARGRDFAGCSIPRPLPAIYGGFEMHESDLAGLLGPIAQGDGFLYEPKILTLSAPLNIDKLRAVLQGEPIAGLLVIDSFRAAFMLGKDCEKDAGAVGAVLRRLSSLAHETGWTIAVIHHFRKSATGDFLDASGSSEWLAAPDAVWLWDRPSPQEPGTLKVIGRMPPREDLSVRVSPSDCEYLGSPQEAREQAEFTELLGRLPSGWASVEDLRANWEGAPAGNTIRDRLNKLISIGKVEKAGSGKKGDPLRFRKIDSTGYRHLNELNESGGGVLPSEGGPVGGGGN